MATLSNVVTRVGNLCISRGLPKPYDNIIAEIASAEIQRVWEMLPNDTLKDLLRYEAIPMNGEDSYIVAPTNFGRIVNVIAEESDLDTYSTGTIGVTTGTGVVAGEGTTFTSAMVNCAIVIAGVAYKIISYTSAVEITISDFDDEDTYSGGTIAALTTYVIYNGTKYGKTWEEVDPNFFQNVKSYEDYADYDTTSTRIYTSQAADVNGDTPASELGIDLYPTPVIGRKVRLCYALEPNSSGTLNIPARVISIIVNICAGFWLSDLAERGEKQLQDIITLEWNKYGLSPAKTGTVRRVV